MAKIILDKNGMVDMPTLILQNRNFDTLGRIVNIHDFTFKENFNSANEVSFVNYKYSNSIKNELWERIVDHKVLYIPEFNERFYIQIQIDENSDVQKEITCTSLCESELSNIRLYNIEINTENDILSEDYDEDFPTVFYRDPSDYPNKTEKEVKRASLLHRILEKAPHYSIRYVQDSLKSLTKAPTFTISDSDIYSELTGEIAEEFGCIFLFDSMTREISVYDLYNTCKEEGCGYRGDFSERCPECGKSNFGGQYGDDTTVFISNENLSTQVELNTNKDSMKNCFFVEGGDDIMNAAIRSINPNGSQYIFEITNSMKEDMPNELSSVLDEYDNLYEQFYNTQNYTLSKNAVDNYNYVVDYVNEKFPIINNGKKEDKFSRLDYSLTGYPSTTKAMYEAIDLYGFINDSMMPTVDTSGLGIDESMQAILEGFRNGFSINGVIFRNEIAINDHTTATQFIIKNNIENTAKVFYSTAHYYFNVNTNSYTQAQSSDSKGVWNGTFTLTSISERDDDGNRIKKTSGTVTLSISGDSALFIEQKIYRMMSDKDKVSLYDITNIKLDEESFKEQLGLYSLNELQRLSDTFQSCLDILYSPEIEDNELNREILDRYKTFYNTRKSYIDSEIVVRERMVSYIKLIYYPTTDGYSGELSEIRYRVNSLLNFEKFIKKKKNGTKLWNTFCSYRMEDKYSNSNYISDGLTNAEVIEHAQKLLDSARKELYKASRPQYSISTTMNNLLALEEFQPLINSFSVGNWIRVMVDDNVFRLRLLSYQINFDEIQSIDVEFSTVENAYDGASDLQSVISSASSMAKSYAGVMHQMDKSKSTSGYVEDWINEGLKATLTKFVNDDNQEIVIDNHGILGRKYDDIYGNYNPCQFKLLSNGLYLTHDNWITIDTGIGKISYIDPETGELVIDYGIIAKTIVGKLFIGEKLKIYGANNSIVLDENGITMDGGSIRWSKKIPQTAVEGMDDFEKNMDLLLGDVEELKSQADGKIDTWFFDYVPSDSTEPTKTWIANNEQESHKGDLFYCTNPENQHSYRYVYNQETKKYEWMLILDTDVTKALEAASKAQDTADNKRRVFVSQPEPPYDEGDLWVQGSNGDILHCKNAKLETDIFEQSDWEKSSKYTDDSKALEALQTAEDAIQDAANALSNSKAYTDSQYNSLSNTLTDAYMSYANSEIRKLDSSVANYLGIGGSTLVGGSYVISPIIEGGYLNITSGGKCVIIDPKGLGGSNYIFQVHNGKEISVGIKSDGDVEIRGKIYAKDGEFSGILKSPVGSLGGWEIDSTSIFCKSPTYGAIRISTSDFNRQIYGINRSNLRMAFGNNFGVTKDGKLYCGDASIRGEFFATGGSIGGWQISTSGLYYGSLTGNSSGDIGFSTSDFTRSINGKIINGLRFAIGSNFGVTKDGKLFSSSGSIGGFDIGASFLSNNTSVIGESAGSIYLGTDGISCGEDFIVYKDGGCKIGGSITAKGNINLIGGYWTNLSPIPGEKMEFVENGFSTTIKPCQKTYYTASKPPEKTVFGISMENIMVDSLYLNKKTHISDLSVLLDENGIQLQVNDNGTMHFSYIMDFVTQNAYFNNIHTNGISIKKTGFSQTNGVLCPWADGSNHYIVASGNDGLTSYFGWAGTSSHQSVSIIRGRTVKYQNASGTTALSDERLKESFKSLGEMDDVYMDLKPIAFKYKNGNSGRFHFGYGAGQVKGALEKHGFTTRDFAGFVQMSDSEDNGSYCGYDDPMGLIYTEFVPWNTHMIQKIYSENKKLKERVEKLERALFV